MSGKFNLDFSLDFSCQGLIRMSPPAIELECPLTQMMQLGESDTRDDREQVCELCSG